MFKYQKAICGVDIAMAQDSPRGRIIHVLGAEAQEKPCHIDIESDVKVHDFNEYKELENLFFQVDAPIFSLNSDGSVTEVAQRNVVSTVASSSENEHYVAVVKELSITITVELSNDGGHIVNWNGSTVLPCAPGDTFNPLFLTDDGKYLYAVSNHSLKFESLLRIDEFGNVDVTHLDLLKERDIGGIVTHGVSGKDFAAVFTLGDSIEYHFMSPELSSMHARAVQFFPGADILWFNGDATGKRWLCNVLRRDRPESWYLFDVDEESPQPLFEAEGIANVRSAKPIRYRTRDGLTASGYLTTPRGTGPYPTVVFVHGGPSVRVYPWFDARVQALVRRGYAVFQPNYRGSRGLGKEWQQGGWKEWGIGAAQNDISDGVKHLIESGVADPDRIAIFGGSFGGYAALSGLAFTEDLYKCGVSFFGISDLANYLSVDDGILAPFNIPMYGDVHNAADRERLLRQSPLHALSGKNKPVFLYHGVKDSLVAVQQSRDFARHARNLGGTVEYYQHPEAEHGFIDTRHEAAIYFEMLNFLDEHLLNKERRKAPDEVDRALKLMRSEGERAINTQPENME